MRMVVFFVCKFYIADDKVGDGEKLGQYGLPGVPEDSVAGHGIVRCKRRFVPKLSLRMQDTACVQTCTDAFRFESAEERSDEGRLQQSLSAGDRNTAVLAEIGAVAKHFGYHFRDGVFRAATAVPGVRIMAIHTADGASLHEDYEAKPGTVNGTERLKRMDSSGDFGIGHGYLREKRAGRNGPARCLCMRFYYSVTILGKSNCLVEGTGDNLLLLLKRQLVEGHGVARDADGERRIFLRVVHRIDESLAVEHIDI